MNRASFRYDFANTFFSRDFTRKCSKRCALLPRVCIMCAASAPGQGGVPSFPECVYCVLQVHQGGCNVQQSRPVYPTPKFVTLLRTKKKLSPKSKFN